VLGRRWRKGRGASKFRFGKAGTNSNPVDSFFMLTAKQRPDQTIQAWAISILLEEGVIRECEEHGWMKEKGDPHARERTLDLARSDPPVGCSPKQAVAELLEVLNSIGDECPECTSS
jgi:hypothetical protein